jgi:hypothetical protein
MDPYPGRRFLVGKINNQFLLRLTAHVKASRTIQDSTTTITVEKEARPIEYVYSTVQSN